MSRHVYAFLDTMLFLHFRSPTEVDWREFFSADSVEIVISRVLIQELDKHKDHRSRRVQDRARTALRAIEEWSATEAPHQLRDGVRVTVLSAEPSIDWDGWGLNPNRADDALVGTARRFMDRAPGVTALVSDDVGPRITARRLGLDPFQPAEEWRLSKEKDPLEAENERLRQELTTLKARPRPILALEFAATEARHVKLSVPALRYGSEEWFNERMAEIERKHLPFTAEKHLTPQHLTFGLPSADEIKRYNEEVQTFLDQYRGYLSALARRETLVAATFLLNFRLCNSGTGPAADVDVHMHFPDGFEVLALAGSHIPRPKPPKPPTPPRSGAQLVADIARVNIPPLRPGPTPTGMGSANVVDPFATRPQIKKTNSYDVSYHVRALKHHFCMDFDEPVAIRFPDIEAVRSFQVEYSLFADNLPDPEQGTLHVVFET